MIFNYCIYGDILPNYSGEIKITAYDNTLTEVFSKSYNIIDEYQFNLGDRDLFDINYKLRPGSTIVLTLGNKFYKVKLTEDFLHNFDIDLQMFFQKYHFYKNQHFYNMPHNLLISNHYFHGLKCSLE